MRSIILLFFLFAGVGNAAIAVAASNKGLCNSGSVTTCATGATATTTGWIAVVLCQTGTNTVTCNAPTDTAGDTYTAISTATQNSSAAGYESMWQSTNITGNAANVVTCHHASSVNFDECIVAYLSGGATASALDGTGFTTTTPVNASSVTSNTFSTTTAGGVVACAPGNGSVTPVAGLIGGSSSALIGTAAADNGFCEFLRFATAQTNITAAFGWSNTVNGLFTIGAAFKEPGAATGSNTPARGGVF